MDALEAFAILELKNNASKEEIKSAYRKLAKEWHPDIKKSPEAEEKFKRINQAHDLLSKPQKTVQQPFKASPFPNDLFEQFFGRKSGFNFSQSRAPKSASITIELEDITVQLAGEIAQLLAEKGYKIKGYSFSKQ